MENERGRWSSPGRVVGFHHYSMVFDCNKFNRRLPKCLIVTFHARKKSVNPTNRKLSPTLRKLRDCNCLSNHTKTVMFGSNLAEELGVTIKQ